MIKRSSGILMHISSLPSLFGIGDVGPEAYKFVDILSEAKQKYWQVLPLNPTDMIYGNSPYSSKSAFAANPLFISPEKLVDNGFLASEELKDVPAFPEKQVDYQMVTEYKQKLLDCAYERFKDEGVALEGYKLFCSQHQFWLDDYALFVVLKNHWEKMWKDWPHEVRGRRESALNELREKFVDQIERVKFAQFIFYTQWGAFKKYCNEKGVQLIGDIPIYVNEDSSDVWVYPQFFKLDKKTYRPKFIAGVPPDYFSETGQRWGNPVYDWNKIKEDGYGWWMKRLKHNLSLFDVVRIDHFRGLVAYWEIPVKEETAINGKWEDGPKDEFFEAVKQSFPELPIIAEDLGIITQDVTDTMERFHLPGMKVLHFAFSGNLEEHPYIPDNYTENCVVYTGTHDNNTTIGWFHNDVSGEEKANLNQYLQKEITDKNVCEELIALAMKSRACLSVIPLQDILALGQSARMNTPATCEGNWIWRLSSEIPSDAIQRIATLVNKTQRG